MCPNDPLLHVRDLVCPTMGFCPLSYRRVVSLINRHPGGFESCRAEINQILVEVSVSLFFFQLLHACSFFFNFCLFPLFFCLEPCTCFWVPVLSLRKRSGQDVHERFRRAARSRRRLEARRTRPNKRGSPDPVLSPFIMFFVTSLWTLCFLFFSKKIPEMSPPFLKIPLMDRPLGSMLVLALRHLLARFLIPIVVPTGRVTSPSRIHPLVQSHALLQRNGAPLEFGRARPLGSPRKPLSPILLVALSSLSSNISAAPSSGYSA